MPDEGVYMDDKTDPNKMQAEQGDVPDVAPAERLRDSLEQLEEDGELDSGRVTFETRKIRGVDLDEVYEILQDVDYDRHPVRITIEPMPAESGRDSERDYQVHFDDLGTR